MSNSVLPEIYELLKKAVEDDINNYLIINNGVNGKGAGFLGEINFVSMENKDSKKILNVIIKQAFSNPVQREICSIREIYVNEICFYTKIWPEFKIFQSSALSTTIFNKIPRSLATSSVDGAEKLVLENLNYENFQMFNKKDAFDQQHFEFIFNEYGKFHGLSFAYKENYPEEFFKLAGSLTNTFSKIMIISGFVKSIKSLCEDIMTSFLPGKDDEIIKMFERYIRDTKIIETAAKYKGEYSAILHGDCWSNNMMFKYDENNQVEDIRLLDFQLSSLGTPVFDLSYCLYSGGNKGSFDNLDHYLKVYHDSLSKTLREFGCDPLRLFPFEQLKKDWKKYSKFGFIMGLNLWKIKLTEERDIIDVSDYDGNLEALKDKMSVTNYDEVTYKKRSRELVLHMYENDFL